MSFDLTVSFPPSQPNLKQAWEQELGALDFDVEIWPSFDSTTWSGGFLPFRVSRAPFDLTGVNLSEPIISGFEVSFRAGNADFCSSMGRTTTEFALQCLGAATFAKLSGGQYIDGQNGVTCNGEEAILAAKDEVRRFVAAAKPKDLATAKFPGWDRFR